MKKKPKDISRGIRLDRDTWKALDRVREAQGRNGKPASYNAVLKAWLSAGIPKEIPRVKPPTT